MIVVWAVVLILCVAGASLSSRHAVTSALRITDTLNVSPALVGVTVIAIGTDLPEIANSIVATASDHGDLNVGDSMGSVVTQVTLVLGLLCLFGRDISANRNFVISVGLATVFASTVVWIMVGDGEITHLDGLILILLWFGGTALLGHGELSPRQLVSEGQGSRTAADIGMTLVWLGLVGGFAIGIVQAFLQIADRFGIPEFVGGFIALAIGTSLPELVVDLTAIRRGASSMAVGDVFGSSFVDSTLSVGIGPLLFSSLVSSEVTTGVAIAAVGVLVATILTVRSRSYRWPLGVALLATYATAQLLVAFASG
ncbi:MAG: sodium:calcium antiporter [Actinomycetia bacterium]|nr:sodium:calcium antiporter [Actinomycetes bacterium]MCP4228129.1 sodium:calcium antiporter [Actinomycetes bacterium]MCP5035807.1 sodium:calcium antiporter [Actinomycetes bacterium]